MRLAALLGPDLRMCHPLRLPLSPQQTLPAAADFSLASAAGQHGQAVADLLLGCMEVAMEDLVEELTGGEWELTGGGMDQLPGSVDQLTGSEHQLIGAED